MRKPIFNPEQFSEPHSSTSCRYWASDIANKILNAEIEKWPVVYGCMIDNDKVVGTPFGQVLGAYDTHRARLAFIEEIKKECVKHEPIISLGTGHKSPSYFAKCKHCGVELQATWSEKK